MTVRELWTALLGNQLLCFDKRTCEDYDLPNRKYTPHEFVVTFHKSFVWNRRIIVLHTGMVNELPGTAVLLTIELEAREE